MGLHYWPEYTDQNDCHESLYLPQQVNNNNNNNDVTNIRVVTSVVMYVVCFGVFCSLLRRRGNSSRMAAQTQSWRRRTAFCYQTEIRWVRSPGTGELTGSRVQLYGQSIPDAHTKAVVAQILPLTSPLWFDFLRWDTLSSVVRLLFVGLLFSSVINAVLYGIIVKCVVMCLRMCYSNLLQSVNRSEPRSVLILWVDECIHWWDETFTFIQVQPHSFIDRSVQRMWMKMTWVVSEGLLTHSGPCDFAGPDHLWERSVCGPLPRQHAGQSC